MTPQDLRRLQALYTELSGIESRKQSVLALLEKKGILTDRLRSQLSNAQTMDELEDIYAPFKKVTLLIVTSSLCLENDQGE